MSNQVYCTAPWNGLTIREDGKVKTCCVGRTTLGDLNQVSIHDIRKSTTLNQIQQDMLSNNPNLDNCQLCINQENQNGLATLRQHYLKYYPEIDARKHSLKFIDVRWNNSCNLGCLYCSTTFSSTWEKRLHQVKKISPKKAYQDELLDWILEEVNDIKEIMLVGGEPMLMKQNYALLSRVPPSCKISIITNLNYDLENLPCWPDLMRHQKNLIVWNISLENIGEQFEYVRSGGSWAQIQKNLELLQTHWSDNISINMVYSVFSAFNLAETFEYFSRLGIKKINLFPVNQNDTIDIANFPDQIRKIAADQLQLAQHQHFNSIHPEDRDFYPIQGVNSLLEFLLNSHSKNTVTLEQFDKKIKWYDQWNEKKFVDLWPDVDKMIRLYLK